MILFINYNLIIANLLEVEAKKFSWKVWKVCIIILKLSVGN